MAGENIPNTHEQAKTKDRHGADLKLSVEQGKHRAALTRVGQGDRNAAEAKATGWQRTPGGPLKSDRSF
jgi:hypothetical protein